MQTVTFFSFKGGVGRTYTMLNVAYEVARLGAFVVVADWDLHAPGLTLLPEMAPPTLNEGEVAIRKGVLDFIQSALPQHDQPTPEILDPSAYVMPTQLATQARQENDNLLPREQFKGDLHFIPAGRFNPAHEARDDRQTSDSAEHSNQYHQQLRDTPLNELNALKQEKKHLKLLKGFTTAIARGARSDVFGPEKAPDFLFIDCRTGLTELSDLTLDHVSNHIVVVSGLNRQNLAGLESTLDTIVPTLAFNNLPSHLTIVLSPVPSGEDELVKQSFQRVEALIQSRLREKPGEGPEHGPEILQIPYHPRIALVGGLLIRDFPHSLPVATYKQLVQKFMSTRESTEETRLKTEQKIQKVTGKEDKEQISKTTSGEPSQRPHPFSVAPDWNWFDPGISPTQLLPTETDKQQAHLFLQAISRNLSLGKDAKLRILRTYGQLTSDQVQDLLHIFREEASQHLASPQNNDTYIASLIGKNVSNWLSILEQMGLALDQEVLCATLTTEQAEVRLGGIVHFVGFWYAVAAWAESLQLWSTAEALYQKAIALDPNDAVPCIRLGNLYQEHLQRQQEAEQAYKKAIALDPSDGGIYYNLGNLYQNHLQRYQEAEHAYKKAIELDPNDGIAYNDLGNLYTQHLQRHEEAEGAYKKAIELDPNLVMAYNNLGILYQGHLQRYQEAEHAYKKAIELDPNDANTYNGLGYLYQEHLQRQQEAEQAYKKAMALDPNNAEVYNSLGNLYQNHLQRHEEAEQAYKTGMELDTSNGFCAANWALLKLRQGDVKEAQGLMEIARQREPTQIAFLHEEGLLLLVQGEANRGYQKIAEAADAFENLWHHQIDFVRELLVYAPYLGEHQAKVEALAEEYRQRFDLDESLFAHLRPSQDNTPKTKAPQAL